MKVPSSKLVHGNYLFQYLATLSGSFAVLTPGVNLGWTSPYLPEILSGKYPELVMTTDQGYLCAIMSILGAPLGAFFTIFIIDRIGRKTTILLFAPVAFASFILLAFSNTIYMIFASRFILGIIEGGLFTAMPMYFGEISNPSIRGILTSSIGTAAIIGTLLINVLGFYYSIFVSAIVCSFIPVIHFVTFIWMPESPYYYIKKGSFDKAKKSLQLLRGTTDVDDEVKSLTEAINRQEKTQRGRLLDLFTVKSNQRAVLVYVIMNLTKRFSGKNPFLYYTTTIFQNVHAGVDAKMSVIIYISAEVIATISALFLIDNINRRPLIITCTIGCAISLALTGSYFYLKFESSPLVDVLSWLPLTALIIYIICFSFGLELTPTIFMGELFPMNVKAMAHGLGDTFAVVGSLVTTKIFQALSDKVDIFLPFWIFSGCCFAGVIFIFKYVPETRNKTLEEIQLYLISKTTKSKF